MISPLKSIRGDPNKLKKGRFKKNEPFFLSFPPVTLQLSNIQDILLTHSFSRILLMWNEILFVTQSILVSGFAIGAVFFGSGALYAFTSVAWVLGNLFVVKEVTLFGLDVVTSDVFAIGSNMGVTLLREYYGQKEAKRSIGVGIYTAIFFLIVSQFLIMYIPNTHDTSSIHYDYLLGFMPRIIIASFIVSAISKSINLGLFNIFTKKLGDGYFYIKSMGALLIAQLADTILFAFLGLYGNVANIGNIIVFSYIVKVIAISIAVPCISLCHKYLIPKGKD